MATAPAGAADSWASVVAVSAAGSSECDSPSVAPASFSVECDAFSPWAPSALCSSETGTLSRCCHCTPATTESTRQPVMAAWPTHQPPCGSFLPKNRMMAKAATIRAGRIHTLSSMETA